MPNRRQIVQALTVGAALGACSSEVGRPESSPTNRAPLDFSVPEDNLYGYLKLFGDISGKRTYFYQPGRIFGHRDGQLPVHILNYSGITLNEVRRIHAGRYITRYIGWMLMRDPKTNEIIDTWTNPWSGEQREIRHFTTTGGKRTHHTNGMEYPPGMKGKSSWFDKPFIMPWQILEDDVWAPNELFAVYTDSEGNERYESAIHTYHGRLSDIENRSITNAPSTIASQSESPYFPWMGGTDLAGHMILTSLGRKLTKLDQIPNSVLEGVEKRYPGQLDTVFPWEDSETAT